jgi:DNA mismatch repair protein MutL
MPRINVLPLNLRNKIAAGEVVERPASVVKELMENAIDAGASRIEIDILKAGKRLIKVSDNGIGMDREDSLLAFERYATSKIKDESDLFNIRTMGFRGEALSSIASVSKVRMVTVQKSEVRSQKSEDKEIGTCVEIIGGEIKEIKDCPAIGTTIEIKDLFFNTPARRKFLKSDSTEKYHIIDTVTREAISHFQTGFVLRIDDEDVLNLSPASSYKERLVQIFGKDFVDELMETEAEDNQISIKAFLGKAANLRNNRNNQFLFINNRPIKDQSITYAVYKAYEELIPKDKHPIFFLFMGINPKRVDFNVHPTKKEVRFEDKGSVFNFVHQAAKKALKNGVMESQKAGAIEYWSNGETATQYIPQCSITPTHQYSGSVMISEPVSLYDIISYVGSIPFLYLGDTFVAIHEKNGLTIVDYHAAHERINYERLLQRTEHRRQKTEDRGQRTDKNSLSSDSLTSVFCPIYRLLFPQQIKLQSSEYKVILDNLQVLNELGIELEDFGHSTLIIRSIPEFLRDADLNALMSDMAASLINEGQGLKVKGQGNDMLEPIDSVRKVLAAKLACHKSIRGREVPDGARIAQLLKDLDEAENPHICPHGRPTRIFISMDELRKIFKK